jgi:hypothetical protein
VLLNNLAYALIELGRLTEAKPILAQSGLDLPSTQDRVAYLATSGLLAYREGNKALGRELYLQAIKTAAANGLTEMRAMAQILLAREELRLQNSDLLTFVGEAFEASRAIEDPGVKVWRQRLSNEVRANAYAATLSPKPVLRS